MGNEDILREPHLLEMRRVLAAELNHIAKTLIQEETEGTPLVSRFFHPDLPEHSRYGDYVRNTGARFQELANVMTSLNTSSHTVALCVPSLAKLSNT